MDKEVTCNLNLGDNKEINTCLHYEPPRLLELSSLRFAFLSHGCKTLSLNLYIELPHSVTLLTPLLTKLHWLNIKHRIDFKIILIMYKAINGAALPYTSDLTSLKLNSKYGLRSKDTLLLQPPSVRTSPTIGNWAFSLARPKTVELTNLFIR